MDQSLDEGSPAADRLAEQAHGDLHRQLVVGGKTGNSRNSPRRATACGPRVMGAPPAIRGWKWSWWQYTDRAKVPGINGGTDANVWKSSNASLRKAAGLPPLP